MQEEEQDDFDRMEEAVASMELGTPPPPSFSVPPPREQFKPIYVERLLSKRDGAKINREFIKEINQAIEDLCRVFKKDQIEVILLGYVPTTWNEHIVNVLVEPVGYLRLAAVAGLLADVTEEIIGNPDLRRILVCPLIVQRIDTQASLVHVELKVFLENEYYHPPPLQEEPPLPMMVGDRIE